MAKKQRDNILSQYVTVLFPTESKKSPLPLKDQSQIPFILDTLSRRDNHHVALYGSYSETYNHIFLENIAQHFAEEHIPITLRNAFFFYLDIDRLRSSNLNPTELEEDLKAFCTEISSKHARIILAINQSEPLLTCESNTLLGCLANVFKPLLTDDQWRIIVATKSLSEHTAIGQSYLQQSFPRVKLSDPTTADSLGILKSHRDDLENFHHVIIPDETFAYAFSMATHYLSGQQSSLDKALQLLDSGAARASAVERTDQSGQFKPILTNMILAHIVSSWTQIPLSHLQHNKFRAADFIQGMQKHIFGQEAAINLIGLALQHARIKLQTKSGPLCSFLFAGPPNIGKTETAFAIAEQLFGHKGALLRVKLDKTLRPHSLADIKVMAPRDDNHFPTLFEAIQQCPYAVVLLENINQAPPGTVDLFQDIFTQGYAMDQQGNRYDFRHAIVIVTTTLGAERIISLTQPQAAHEAAQTADLMQLVLNEHPHESVSRRQHLSPQELCEEMMPALETYFSMKILRHLNIVPFILLDYPGVEKIIRLKLKQLSKQLDTNHGIELSYAPETIRFLVQETLWRGESTRPIDKILDQHLFSCVAHELVSHMDDKNRPKRLLLQLNDAGQLLRCEFVSTNDATLYKL
ncbi:MAG: AAA family ATPase [Gammaproteobacteria bacterium]|nr:AAA family ATPase [Gammaproteobacteria bacterium]